MTHDAKRSGDVRARIAALAGDAPRSGARARRALDRAHGAVRRRRRPRRRRALLHLPDAGRRLADRARAARGPPARRRCERPSATPAGSSQNERVGARRSSASPRRCADDPAFTGELRAVRPHGGARRRAHRAGPAGAEADAPGVPDIYQGDELELRALVDPDNRRPVDWDLRQARLAHLLGGGRPGAGDHKLWITSRLLGLRARRATPLRGSYEPLDAGPGTCAFVRGGEVLTIVALPRAGEEQGAASLDPPAGRWREVLTGDERSFARREPVAKLVSENRDRGLRARLSPRGLATRRLSLGRAGRSGDQNAHRMRGLAMRAVPPDRGCLPRAAAASTKRKGACILPAHLVRRSSCTYIILIGVDRGLHDLLPGGSTSPGHRRDWQNGARSSP